MNKNVLIGILVVVVLIIAGMFAFKGNITSVTPVTVEEQPVTETPATPSQPLIAGAPVAETGSGVIVSNSTGVVSGKVNPKGAPTTYWYAYGLTSELGNKTSMQNIGSGFTALTSPGYITGLKANTEYFFQLNASNSLGISAGAVYSFKTNSTPPPAGKAPVTETSKVSDVSRTSATLNARVNAEGYATSYWFEFGETSNLGNLTGYTGTGSGQSFVGVSAPLTNLKPLTKYYFRVNAQNQFGTVTGSVVSFTTTGPAVPAQASAPLVNTTAVTNLAASSVTLNGKLDPHGADTTYWFEYSKDSLLGKVVGTATPNQTMGGAEAAIGVKADVSGLSRNTKYFFRLVARNQYGTTMGDVTSFKTK